jgi:anti-anti-sigma factor
MNIKAIQASSDIVIISISGKFTIEEVTCFEDEFFRQLPGKKTIALDISGLKYIDSAGIGAFIKGMNNAKNQNKEFVLYEIDPLILNVFKLAYLDRFFTIRTKKEMKERYPEARF